MMGTLAAVLAGKKIKTDAKTYRADVRGDIENVDGVLKITRIHVEYHLENAGDRKEDVLDAMDMYLAFCPGAQSVIGCIDISDEMVFE